MPRRRELRGGEVRDAPHEPALLGGGVAEQTALAPTDELALGLLEPLTRGDEFVDGPRLRAAEPG